MANEKMKKAVAITLAMAMCWSTLSVQAFAAEVTSGEGTVDDPTLKVTVTVTEDGNTTTTKTESEWTGDGENDGTTTTVTGSETKTETETVDSKDRVTTETGHVEGSETTTTETTETEQTIVTQNPSDTSPEAEDWGNWESTGEFNPTVTDETDAEGWVEGTPTNNDNWTETTASNPQESKPSQPITSQAIIPNPLDETNVELKFDFSDLTKPDPEAPEALVELQVTEQEVLLKNFDGFDRGIVEKLMEYNGEYPDPDNENVKYVAITNEDGNVITGYKKITTEVKPGTPGDPQNTNVSHNPGAETNTPVLPDDWNKDAGDVKDADGNVIGDIKVTNEPIYKTDAKGNYELDANGDKIIEGYRITKTKTTKSNADVPAQLGTKPAESETTDENGVTTKVTVQEFNEDGKTGYQVVTVKTKGNKEIYSATEKIYATETTKNETTTVETEVTEIYSFTQTGTANVEQQRVTDIVTNETTESKNYQLVVIGENLFYTYTGDVLDVRDNSATSTTKLSMEPNKPLYNGESWQTATDDIQGHGDSGTDYSWYMKYTDAEREAMKKKMLPEQYVLVGYGLYSEYNVYDDQKTPHAPRQYVVMDNAGNLFYGYCVELNKSIIWGENGSYTQKTGDQYEQGGLYFPEGETALDYISSVANNGFWGSSQGLGSLDAVRNFLTRAANAADTEEEKAEYLAVAQSITAGQALAATQAAIWKYGNHKDGELQGSMDVVDMITEYYFKHDPDATKTTYVDENGNICYSYNKHSIDDGYANNDSSGDLTFRNIEVLFGLLTEVAESSQTFEVDPITKEDLTSASIILNSKTNDSVDVNGNKHDVYDSDVAFTLAVSTSDINGDLLVYVYANGDTSNPVAVKRLAGTNSVDQSYKTIHPDKNGVYTIEGVQLAEGLTITLNLEGTQHLADGIYIYDCLNSQNFVGLAKKDHVVDLEVDMKFEVDEPSANVENTTDKTGRTKTETRTDTRTGTRAEKRQATETTVVYADVTVTEVTETETNREWTEDWEETFTYPSNNKPDPIIPDNTPTDPVDPVDPVIPDEPTPETPVDPEIPEEPVPEAPVEIPDETPLADVPKTGDISALWYGLTLLSGGGLLGLFTGRKGKEEQ